MVSVRTPSFFPIERRSSCPSRKVKAEVREITRSCGSWESELISDSVSPSLR